MMIVRSVRGPGLVKHARCYRLALVLGGCSLVIPMTHGSCDFPIHRSSFESERRLGVAGDGSAIMSGADQTADFGVMVTDTEGNPLLEERIDWCLTDESHVSISNEANQTVSVRTNSFEVSSTELVGRSEYGMSEVRIPIILADLAADVVLIQSSDVTSGRSPMLGETQTVLLASTPQTQSIAVGSVVASGDAAGILLRVVDVDTAGDEVSIEGESANLGELFDSVDISVNTPTVRSLVSERATAEKGFGLECEAESNDGTVFFSEDIDPSLATEGSARFEMDDSGFGIFAMASLQGEVNLGKVEASIAFAETIACELEFADIPLLPIPIGPLRFEFALEPEIQVSLESKLSAWEGELALPIVEYGGSLSGGVSYDTLTQEWRTESDATPQLDVIIPDRNDLLEFRNEIGFEVEVEASAGAELEIDAKLGLVPGLSVDIASIELIALRFFAALEIDFPFPFASMEPQYRGPAWKVNVGSRVELEPEFEFEIDLSIKDLMDRLAKLVTDAESVGVFLDTPITLSEKKTKILGSPLSMEFSADCDGNECEVGEPVDLRLLLDSDAAVPTLEGTANFLRNDFFDANLSPVSAQLSVDDGSGQSVWIPPASLRGKQVSVFPRVSLDPISRLYPYGDSPAVIDFGVSSSIEITPLGGRATAAAGASCAPGGRSTVDEGSSGSVSESASCSAEDDRGRTFNGSSGGSASYGFSLLSNTVSGSTRASSRASRSGDATGSASADARSDLAFEFFALAPTCFRASGTLFFSADALRLSSNTRLFSNILRLQGAQNPFRDGVGAHTLSLSSQGELFDGQFASLEVRSQANTSGGGRVVSNVDFSVQFVPKPINGECPGT